MINIIKKPFVYNRFKAITGAFGLVVKNRIFKPVVQNYLQTKNELMVSKFLNITYSINLHTVVNHQIPIDHPTKHNASQPPGVSSLQAYQTPAR